MRQIGAVVVLTLLVAASVAHAHPTPVPIPLNPTPPTPAPPGTTPAYVCVWIQVKGPGPHPFTPAPGQDIRDVEVDIPGDEHLPPGEGYLPQPVAGQMGPFNAFQMIDLMTEPEFGLHVNVGHWYDGWLAVGNLIEISNPLAGPEDTWYVHFTPEPATLALLAASAACVAVRRKGRR